MINIFVRPQYRMHQPHQRLNPKRFFRGTTSHRKRITWKRRGRYIYLRFIRLQGSPNAIARGLSVGAFAGMFPIFGFQILFGIFLAACVRGNKLTAAAATWISNPFTYLPLFAFNFQVGQWLLQAKRFEFNQLQKLNWQELLALGPGFIATWFTGCFVMGCLAAILGYGLGLWLVLRLRHKYAAQRQKT
ncbi:DUF2062 domain-containing protein [Acaryochloris sp. 'Moss Beach']|uniref:DUF2062 domain-containing protein n=1 Tax=Acaryochloris sp. 'Moss Beach' TaxID=2740837 RepID=UPI001F2522D9|nr:DUF2062 domain-containing protein [Acaryochloris sp. 'Moss Beach']